MFTVIKRMEISASHKLVLPYRSKCASLHGHNWIIIVYSVSPAAGVFSFATASFS
jgi:6-pyruvoyl-tetrahydropterin synthase